ncbi:MAG TPA: 50S ribosomal protein L29 [Nitrospirota bacterium]|nr:50S ribosomal protein L29 [Nitrospirota bacterium]
MKLTELLAATIEELKGRETELKREMFNLRFQQAVGGSLENPMRIRNVKKEIARIKTVVQQRKAEG